MITRDATEQRMHSLVALCELPLAEAEAQAMLALAQRTNRPAHEAQALCALALVQTRQERSAQALESATAAEAAAKRVRSAAEREALLALAPLRQATAALNLDPPKLRGSPNKPRAALPLWATLPTRARRCACWR